MSEYTLKYKAFGAHKLLIEWPSIIDEKILYDIIAFKKVLKKNDQVLTVQNAYQSVCVEFIAPIKDYENTVAEINALYHSKKNKVPISNTLWKIPVCYDPEIASDQIGYCQAKKITPDELVALHTAAVYCVYFTGFLPGFPYLGGLHKKLFQPRKETPARSVPKGAVAIGGEQTGIYPVESPGGWHVIGRTPIELFQQHNPSPTFLEAGDKLKFTAISLEEYHTIATQVANKTYRLTKDVWNG